jgi:hypothetical protein
MEPELRHRTDIPKFQDMYDNLKLQLMTLSGETGFNLRKDEKIQIRIAISETIASIINVTIAISETLHDYKDRELDKTLKDIESKANTFIDLKQK